jgi:N-acetyl-gamma-glutamyl-phosphate reductase
VADLPIGETVGDAELIFLAVPHGIAATLGAQLRSEGRRVIDISADFRLRDPAQYLRWYGHEHPAPAWLPEAIYGLCEWHRDALQHSLLVANPGCFPTGALLALLPACVAGLIEPDIIIDAKTGVTGAGRSPSRRVHFDEVSDSITAYGVTGHRHLPEIENELAALAKESPAQNITFIPHLAPMHRGILSTCYATLRPGVDMSIIQAAYRDRYADEPFITLLDQPPETGWVRGTNRCLLFISVNEAHRRLIIISAIDNLMKGGAGQAVQCANLMYDLPETAGLEMGGIWP